MRSAYCSTVTPIGPDTGCCMSHSGCRCRTICAAEQQLDLHQHMGDAIENMLQTPLRLSSISRPGLSHEPRADAEPQCRRLRAASALQPNRLTDEAALRANLPVGHAAGDIVAHVAPQGAIDRARIGDRDRLAVATKREREDR